MMALSLQDNPLMETDGGYSMKGLKFIQDAGTRYTPNGTSRKLGLYLCFCGKEFTTDIVNVKRGQKSCGCIFPNREAHGMSGTVTHKRWEDMKQRCSPNFRRSDRYHDRGIGYQESWSKFAAFYADMGDCPEGAELDRIDNDKGYSKDNCRWTSRSMNMRNRSETNKRQSIGTIQNVFWNKHRQKFQVHCSHEGKRKYLGQYDTEEAGRLAYNAFARQHGYPERQANG